MSPLGLIAGEGVFPLLVARGARKAGRKVVCVGFRGSAWEELREEADSFSWVNVARPNDWIRLLRRGGCSEAVMVGRVRKDRMYGRLLALRSLPDWRAIRMWITTLRRDKRPGTVLAAMRRELASGGIALIDSTQYCSEHLVTPGVLTRRQPTEEQWADIRAGWELCTTLSRLDIGQSLALLHHDVLAVEALEGTDAMIERAGKLCPRGGWTLIKVANTTGDMRLDVPCVGVTTIERLFAAGAHCLVLQAHKTIMLEKPKVLELAERYKIAIVGYEAVKT